MKIQVLGSGCPTCKKLLETTKKVARELNIDAEIEYVTDVTKMIAMGVMTSPVLAIDGQPVLSGGSKSEEEIKEALCASRDSGKAKQGSGGCCCGNC